MVLLGGDEVAQPAQNRSVIIELKVDDKGLADYLQNYIVQKPTTMPWGNKSMLFRDHDGNLLTFLHRQLQKQ